eukprot:scpid32536/ scgid24544/ 
MSSLYECRMSCCNGPVVRRASTLHDLAYWQNWIGLTDGVCGFLAMSSDRQQALAYCLIKTTTAPVCDSPRRIDLAELCYARSHAASRDGPVPGDAASGLATVAATECLRNCFLSCTSTDLQATQQHTAEVVISMPKTLFDDAVFSAALSSLGLVRAEMASRMDNGFMFILLDQSALSGSAQQRVTSAGREEESSQSPAMSKLLAPLVFSRLDLF